MEGDGNANSGAGMNPFMRQQHRVKRDDPTHRHRRPSTDENDRSSPLFMPQDEHYDNEQATRRRRLALPPLPGQHVPGDGLDFRRPVQSTERSTANTQSVIDLTEEDDTQAGAPENPTGAGEPSNRQRAPRFGRDLLNDQRNFLSNNPGHGLRLPSRERRREDERPMAPSHDEIEFISARPTSRTTTASRNHTPADVAARQRTNPPAAPDNQIDLTEDDDVVITDARPLERGGVNATRPAVTAGLGVRAVRADALADILRRTGANQGGRLFQLIDRGFGGEGGAHNMIRPRDAMDGGARPNAREVAFAARHHIMAMPGHMNFEAVGFDMGIAGGNRPPSPKYEAPSNPGPGFTRSPREDEEVVCPNCGDELAMGEDDVKQQIWVVRSCGHAYCGHCAQSRSRSNKKKGKARVSDGVASEPFKKCVVIGCDKPTTSKAAMVQTYLGAND